MTANAKGCGFDSHSCSGEARNYVLPLNTQCFQNSATLIHARYSVQLEQKEFRFELFLRGFQ